MPGHDDSLFRPRRRRVPVVTASLSAVALVLLLVVAVGVLPGDHVWGLTQATLFLLPLPPLLAIAATVAATLDRHISELSKVLWAVGSGLFALLYVPALWAYTVLVAGP